MLRRRRSIAAVAAVMAVGATSALGVARAGGTSQSLSARSHTPSKLVLFYTPPVLARYGERVRVPVGLVCATPAGRVCSASLSVRARVGSGEWTGVQVGAVHQTKIDLSAPAARAVRAGGAGSVEFFMQAQAADGQTLALPISGASAPMRFYVARDMPTLDIPEVSFGATRRGRTVLFLPWGSGAMRAGLRPGRESATLGPSSFDVDSTGRIYLLDSEQDRLAVFSGGRLVRQVGMPVRTEADVAVTAQGTAYVADRVPGAVTLRRVGVSGGASVARVVGSGILGQVRAVGEHAAVNLLPEDRWVASDVAARPSAPTTGRPLADGTDLLRAGTEHRIRLGVVSGESVSSAVELVASERLAEIPLAESRRPGDYWVIAHVWRETPTPADRFQVIHVADRRVVRSFAVTDASFADQPPMSRFRLEGRFLYQLATSPDGMRIVRFDLGRES